MIFHKNQIILATLNYKTKNKKTKKIFMKENFKIQSKICMHYWNMNWNIIWIEKTSHTEQKNIFQNSMYLCKKIEALL